MRRLLPGILLAALPFLALSYGEMEPGPDIEVALPSGTRATVATWVLVADSDRHFEAQYQRTRLPDDQEATYQDLKFIRRELAGQIADSNANDIMVSVCTDSSAPDCATCFWASEDLVVPKTCLHSGEGLTGAAHRRLTSGCS